MTVLVRDRKLGEQLIAERKARGLDRYDEVWEGLYVMAPRANNEHVELQNRLGAVFTMAVGLESEYRIAPGANITDQHEDWKSNYRCPDVVVFAPGTNAVDYDTHWVGGPDLAVEVRSDDDSAREKLDFYSRVGVRELMIIDREPWSLELLRHDGTALRPVAKLTPGSPDAVASTVVPLSFRLLAPTPDRRPRIEATHATTAQVWSI